MKLKCRVCGQAADLSPLRIGRPHARCASPAGRWMEAAMARTSQPPLVIRKVTGPVGVEGVPVPVNCATPRCTIRVELPPRCDSAAPLLC